MTTLAILLLLARAAAGDVAMAAVDRLGVSPLQSQVDSAPAGSVVDVAPGVYVGDLVISRPLRLVGHGRPRLVGSGRGSVVAIEADDVTVDGFDIDGRDGGDLDHDSSGVHVAGRRAVVRGCRIVHALFGVYLRSADGAAVEDTTIDGVRGKLAGEQGSGIHVYDTHGFRLTGNRIRYMRDGIFIQSSPGGVVTRNVISDLRYGLHYMFSDDNVFEDNVFERSDAGAAVMYSNGVTFRRNQFLDNRGYASVGLLLQACERADAEDNVMANNARGVFLEADRESEFRRNVIADSDVAIVLFDSSQLNRFEANTFVGNLAPLELVGRRTDTIFDRNYWSDANEPDLDGDGVRDKPYRLSNVFDHFRGNLTAADLFAQSVAADVLAQAERAFPVLEPVPVVDAHPLVRPPVHLAMPGTAGARSLSGLVVSASTFAAGALVLAAGGRRSSRRRSRA